LGGKGFKTGRAEKKSYFEEKAVAGAWKGDAGSYNVSPMRNERTATLGLPIKKAYNANPGPGKYQTAISSLSSRKGKIGQ
jgi:hypothetical protein